MSSSIQRSSFCNNGLPLLCPQPTLDPTASRNALFVQNALAALTAQQHQWRQMAALQLLRAQQNPPPLLPLNRLIPSPFAKANGGGESASSEIIPKSFPPPPPLLQFHNWLPQEPFSFQMPSHRDSPFLSSIAEAPNFSNVIKSNENGGRKPKSSSKPKREGRALLSESEVIFYY